MLLYILHPLVACIFMHSMVQAGHTLVSFLIQWFRHTKLASLTESAVQEHCSERLVAQVEGCPRMGSIHTISIRCKLHMVTVNIHSIFSLKIRPRFHKWYYHAWGLGCMSQLCIAVLLLPSKACLWTHQWVTALLHGLAPRFAQLEGYQQCTNLQGYPQSTGVLVKWADTVVSGSWRSRYRGHNPARPVCQQIHSTSRRTPALSLGEDRSSGHSSKSLSAEERVLQHF